MNLDEFASAPSYLDIIIDYISEDVFLSVNIDYRARCTMKTKILQCSVDFASGLSAILDSANFQKLISIDPTIRGNRHFTWPSDCNYQVKHIYELDRYLTRYLGLDANLQTVNEAIQDLDATEQNVLRQTIPVHFLTSKQYYIHITGTKYDRVIQFDSLDFLNGICHAIRWSQVYNQLLTIHSLINRKREQTYSIVSNCENNQKSYGERIQAIRLLFYYLQLLIENLVTIVLQYTIGVCEDKQGILLCENYYERCLTSRCATCRSRTHHLIKKIYKIRLLQEPFFI